MRLLWFALTLYMDLDLESWQVSVPEVQESVTKKYSRTILPPMLASW